MNDNKDYKFQWYSILWSVLRPILVFVSALILVFGVASLINNKIQEKWIMPVDRSSKTAQTFIVDSGDSLSKVSGKLEKQGLIRSASFFKYYADFLGFSKKLQPGEYSLSQAMTVREIAETLTAGDGKPIVKTITIIPGWTVEDVANYLLKQRIIASKDSFLNKCRSAKDYAAYYYVNDILSGKSASNRKYVLEGYLAADTYEIYADATEDDIIKKLLSQVEALFKEPVQLRMQEIGLSMDETLTLASLIEKEAKKHDFANVSAVFHNRLNKKMSLGSDVTIKYILGTKRMVLSAQDLKLASPYNSYTNKGLPPGPICNPSPDAIMAALYPNEDFIRENILYFCSKNPDTGELHFSKTLKEHNQAVKIYAPLWEAFDKKNANK